MHFGEDIGPRMGRLAEGLATIDPGTADRPTLVGGLRGISRLRSYCDALEAAFTPALEAQDCNPLFPPADGSDPEGGGSADEAQAGTEESACTDPDATSASEPEPDVPRESAEELARRLARSKWLKRCERFAAALMAGAIKGEHIDALAAVLAHVEPTVVAEVLAEEDRLLEVARRVGHTAFGRYVRDVVDRVRADGGMSRLERQLKDTFASCKPDELTGMYSLFAKFDPIRGGEIAAALQQRVDALYQTAGATTNLSYGQVVAKALHELLCAPAHDDERDSRRPATPGLLIIADAQSFIDGEHAHTVCETAEGAPVPLGYARSLIAEATIVVAVAGADGRILNVGRTERLANWAQRYALRAMYRHCAYPGCRVPESQCHVHHLIPWEDGGLSDLGNLLPLCHRHHHRVHDDHWRLTVDEARTLRCYRPDGTLETTMAFEPLVPALGARLDGRSPPTPSAGASPPSRDGPDPARDGRRASEGPATPRLFDPAA
jgi:hypothetical protein